MCPKYRVYAPLFVAFSPRHAENSCYGLLVSSPAYVPRRFAIPPDDFGRRRDISWRETDSDWTPRELAQLEASKLQHAICLGVIYSYMPNSEYRKLAQLAVALEVKPDRFYRMMTGQAVMQLEDIGRLRRHIGPDFDQWMLIDDTTHFERLMMSKLKKQVGAHSRTLRRDGDPPRAGNARF